MCTGGWTGLWCKIHLLCKLWSKVWKLLVWETLVWHFRASQREQWSREVSLVLGTPGVNSQHTWDTLGSLLPLEGILQREWDSTVWVKSVTTSVTLRPATSVTWMVNTGSWGWRAFRWQVRGPCVLELRFWNRVYPSSLCSSEALRQNPVQWNRTPVARSPAPPPLRHLVVPQACMQGVLDPVREAYSD